MPVNVIMPPASAPKIASTDERGDRQRGLVAEVLGRAPAGRRRARPRRRSPRAPGPTSPTPARGGRGSSPRAAGTAQAAYRPRCCPTEPRLAMIDVDSGSIPHGRRRRRAGRVPRRDRLQPPAAARGGARDGARHRRRPGGARPRRPRRLPRLLLEPRPRHAVLLRRLRDRLRAHPRQPAAARARSAGCMSLALAYALGGLLALAGVVLSLVFTGSAMATTAIGTLIPILQRRRRAAHALRHLPAGRGRDGRVRPDPADHARVLDQGRGCRTR